MLIDSVKHFQPGFLPCPDEAGGIQRASDACFKFTVEICKFERPARWMSEWIEGKFQHHVSGGERPSLIAAQHVNAARSFEWLIDV